MGISSGIPKGAAIAISDMLDQCAKIQPGQEVLLLAHIDGLYGGDNLVDKEAISWIQSAVQMRGANASVLWIDEKAVPHAWRFPPVVKAAVGACDVFINHSFDLTHEENSELKKFLYEPNKPIMVRNFATTASLLCTAWAQTPYELISEIRYQASLVFKGGLNWQLTDENGTHLEGIISPATQISPTFATEDPPEYKNKKSVPATYTKPRKEYRPWPEWLHHPVTIAKTSGIFIFDCMLSWWSRYIGISPYFTKPISLTLENGKITKIEGGDEANALRQFLSSMKERLGDGVYDLSAIHYGLHPQAIVGPHQCPHVLVRRLIEHSHSSNIHFHIGSPPVTQKYPYWMHCTADIRTATFRVGDTLVHDRGHLTTLDNPKVKAIAAKYVGRPGLEPEPRSY